MPTPEMQLISRIIREGRVAFNTTIEWGITQDDFLTQEGSGIFSHVAGYHRTIESKGSIPGKYVFREQYPHFELCDDDSMTTEALCAEVRKRRLTKEVKQQAQEAIENAELDPIAAASLLHSSCTRTIELGMSKKTDIGFGSALKEIISDYNLNEEGLYPVKATWPWPTLQAVTGGVQEDDYVVLYGRPKSMKSWVLSALIAHFFMMSKKVLIYTKEMTPKNIFKRIASCCAKIPYQEFRRGALSPEDKAKFIDFANFLKSMHNTDDIMCLSGKDVRRGGDTVAWLHSKAEKFKPDIICIDGMYLMSDDSGKKVQDHLRVMNISRDISALRLELKVPVIATMQANRKAASHSKAELDEIAYSDAIGQDATIAARVINEKGKPTIALVLGGSREFELHGLRIGGIPSTDFEEKEQMTEKDIMKAKENDAKGDEDVSSGPISTPLRTPAKSNGSGNGLAVDHNKLLAEQMKSI